MTTAELTYVDVHTDKPVAPPNPIKVLTGLVQEFEDAYDHIADLASKGEDIYELTVTTGRKATDDESSAKFQIGYLACLVAKQYGKNRITTWAIEIGKKPDRVKEFRTVCKQYPREQLMAFRKQYPSLTYSDFRDCLPLVKKQSLKHAYAMLAQAAAEHWTGNRLSVEVAKSVGKTIPPATRSWTFDDLTIGIDNRVTIQTGNDSLDINQFVADHRLDPDYEVRLVVQYTVKEETK